MKQEPNTPVSNKDFAAWALTEGAEGEESVSEWQVGAQPGEYWRG